ncbi:MAG TPA: GNAT family N-acetyltransferase [Candidatus Saccharimonadales bacterium]
MHSLSETTIREINPSDTYAIYDLVADLPPLTQHTWYTYWNLFRSFGNSCFLANEPETNNIVAFATSNPVNTTAELEWFGWQLGVKPEYRGSGLREQLQDRMVESARLAGATAFSGTIEPDNIYSYRMFEQLAHRMGTDLEEVGEVSTPSGIEVVYKFPILELG